MLVDEQCRRRLRGEGAVASSHPIADHSWQGQMLFGPKTLFSQVPKYLNPCIQFSRISLPKISLLKNEVRAKVSFAEGICLSAFDSFSNFQHVCGQQCQCLESRKSYSNCARRAAESTWYQPYESMAYQCAKNWTGRARWEYYGYHEDSNGSTRICMWLEISTPI